MLIVVPLPSSLHPRPPPLCGRTQLDGQHGRYCLHGDGVPNCSVDTENQSADHRLGWGLHDRGCVWNPLHTNQRPATHAPMVSVHMAQIIQTQIVQAAAPSKPSDRCGVVCCNALVPGVGDSHCSLRGHVATNMPFFTLIVLPCVRACVRHRIALASMVLNGVGGAICSTIPPTLSATCTWQHQPSNASPPRLLFI